MLKTKYRDDIAAICAEVGLEPSQYVEFAPRIRVTEGKGSDLEALKQALRDSEQAGAHAASHAADVPGAPPVYNAPVPGASASQPFAPGEAQVHQQGTPAASRALQSTPSPRPSSSRQEPGVPHSTFESPAPVSSRTSASSSSARSSARSMAPEPHAQTTEAGRAARGTEPIYGRRMGLRSILQSQPNLPARTLPSRRLARPVVVAPAASGMGCTTLVATLGRLFRSREENVLILDDTRDELLQLHFEYARESTVPDFARKQEPAIPIMNRESVPGLAQQLSQTWFLEPLARFQLEYQWILLDAATLAPALAQASIGGAPIFLVPLLADMRSVHKAVRLLDEVEAFEREMGRHLELFFVLNQFDERDGFHVELREHLQRRLGARLAPLTLRRSQEIEEALAEGMTVIDYAPESEAAADFRALAEWMDQRR